MSEPTKEYLAHIRVKLTDEFIPSPVLSKAAVESLLAEALEAGDPDSPIASVAVSDPTDRRRRR